MRISAKRGWSGRKTRQNSPGMMALGTRNTGQSEWASARSPKCCVDRDGGRFRQSLGSLDGEAINPSGISTGMATNLARRKKRLFPTWARISSMASDWVSAQYTAFWPSEFHLPGASAAPFPENAVATHLRLHSRQARIRRRRRARFAPGFARLRVPRHRWRKARLGCVRPAPARARRASPPPQTRPRRLRAPSP